MRRFLQFLAFSLIIGDATAAVRMPAHFGDGMVMQANAEYG
jgi:hypothetical protein